MKTTYASFISARGGKERRRTRRLSFLFCLCLLTCTACARPHGSCFFHENTGSSTIYVIKQALHTGIAVQREDISGTHMTNLWLSSHKGTFIEFGYGDAYYYTHPAPGLPAGTSALLIPGEAVIHIAAFDENPVTFFKGGRVEMAVLSLQGVEKIAEFVSASLALSQSGTPQQVASGLYGDSAFYKASEPFSIVHNCNDWVLLALKAAGCEVSIPWLATSDSVFEAAAD